MIKVRKITEREWNEALQDHLKRYYKRKKVVRIEVMKNPLGKPQFRRVYFKDGTYVTFAKGSVLKNGKPFWFRHSGGGRYGPKEWYEGKRSR